MRMAGAMRLVSRCGVAVVLQLGMARAEPALFESAPLTPRGEYSKGIEGPAVDAAGDLYVVSFGRAGTIGRVKSGATRSELFTPLPPGSIGNGIRFDRQGRMFVADYKKHNVLVIEPGQRTAKVYFHSDRFNQPNDLAIASDGTLYASDPRFPSAGQIWRITRNADGTASGDVLSSERVMGATNGIDLSPEETTLYVSEPNTRQVWAYRLDGTKLAAPRLIKTFGEAELDGLRTDRTGRIFVARPLAGKVAILAPDKPPETSLVREVKLRGKEPTNLTFGGADGRTVYVTQKDGGFIEQFRSDQPGREPCLQKPAAC